MQKGPTSRYLEPGAYVTSPSRGQGLGLRRSRRKRPPSPDQKESAWPQSAGTKSEPRQASDDQSPIFAAACCLQSMTGFLLGCKRSRGPGSTHGRRHWRRPSRARSGCYAVLDAAGLQKGPRHVKMHLL